MEQQAITEAVIGAAYSVYNEPGYGFLEKVYQRAMQVKLRFRGIASTAETEIRVRYKGVEVGTYRADLWVEDRVIVEIKVARCYSPDDEPQLLNELKATGVKVGLLINFGRTKVEFRITNSTTSRSCERGWQGSAVLRNPGPRNQLSLESRGCGVPQTPATRSPGFRDSGRLLNRRSLNAWSFDLIRVRSVFHPWLNFLTQPLRTHNRSRRRGARRRARRPWPGRPVGVRRRRARRRRGRP